VHRPASIPWDPRLPTSHFLQVLQVPRLPNQRSVPSCSRRLPVSPSPLPHSASRVLAHVWEYGRRRPPTKKIRAHLSAKATLPCLRLLTCRFRSTIHSAISTRQHLFPTSPINPTLKGLGVLIGGGSEWNKSRHQRFSLSGS